jgi:hypothetical protein
VVIDAIGYEDTGWQADQLVRPGGSPPPAALACRERLPPFVLEKIQLLGSHYVSLDELEQAIMLRPTGA